MLLCPLCFALNCLPRTIIMLTVNNPGAQSPAVKHSAERLRYPAPPSPARRCRPSSWPDDRPDRPNRPAADAALIVSPASSSPLRLGASDTVPTASPSMEAMPSLRTTDTHGAAMSSIVCRRSIDRIRPFIGDADDNDGVLKLISTPTWWTCWCVWITI